MDPNATYKEMIEAAEEAMDLDDVFDSTGPEERLIELAQHVINLNTWIKNGGFLPKAWERSKG